MFIQVFIRIIFGGVLACLGFLLSDLYFKDHPLFGFSFLGQTLLAFLSGAFGLLLLPVIVDLIKNWIQSIVNLTIKESVQQFQRIRPPLKEEKEDFSEEKFRRGPILLDTSAIIDGRIGEIISLGFLSSEVIVPRFILSELQHVADSSDILKRNRGRRGLELLEDLEKNTEIKVEILEKDFSKIKAVDSKLVRLAKEMKGKIVTTDYNLNKVAGVSGVRVLNVNELANALKTVVLPGEKIKVKIIQEGKEPRQGVGYLPDGTMVVLEEGHKMMGKTVEAEVSRIFQTAAGRMVFVKLSKKSFFKR